MANELEEKNKSPVLRAFDTLFISVTTQRRSDPGRRHTINTALASLRVVMDCLT
jgi:hypothetical protein